MFRPCALLLALVVAPFAAMGCYEPDLKDCTVRCTRPGDCATGQVCRSDGLCATPGGDLCPPAGGDSSDGGNSSAPLDASSTPHDSAPDLCPLGCTNGSCQNGVCVIDCGTPYACRDSDVRCPPNIPCRVVCGDHACAKHVVCGLASSCEVQCAGDYSCGDVIQCNTNRCEVTCSGASSCKRHTDCSHSCACDVTCTGTSSCVEAAACPAMTCKLGNGCSSQLAGCDSC